MTHLAMSELDRLFSGLYRKTSKVDTQMKAELEKLQDQLEDFHLQVLDINEARSRLVVENENLRTEVKEQRIAREAASPAVARCTQLETDVRRLTQDYTNLQKNYDHVYTMQKSKESILQEAMRIVEDLRGKVKKGEEYKTQAEHLARKAIEMTDAKVKAEEESARLKTDYVTLMQNFKEIKDQVPDLIEENNKFREQTVRLVQENSQLECPGIREGRTDSLCGGCLGCQLKQAQAMLSQTSENLAQRNTERDELKAQLVSVQKSHEENRKLINDQSKQITHLTHILRILRDTMGQISQAPFYVSKKDLANRALKYRMAYIEIHRDELKGDY